MTKGRARNEIYCSRTWCLHFSREFQHSRVARLKGVAVEPRRVSAKITNRFARRRGEQPKADAKENSDDRSGDKPDRDWQEQDAYCTRRGLVRRLGVETSATTAGFRPWFRPLQKRRVR